MVIDINNYEFNHSCDMCKYQCVVDHTCVHPMYAQIVSTRCDYPNTAHSRLCEWWEQREVGTIEDL